MNPRRIGTTWWRAVRPSTWLGNEGTSTVRFRLAGRHVWGAMAVTAVTMLALPTNPVAALPPGGASGDTPGTSASVSPKTLRAGQTIAFRVTGFPAGETVSVKIDDGDFCSKKGIHGACVVHQQKAGAGGTVQGSFALPDDLGAGKHWLRFLASAEVIDSEGRYMGVKPYSLRGGATFTVVAAQERTPDRAAPDSPSEAAGGAGQAAGPSSGSTDEGVPAAADPQATGTARVAGDGEAGEQESASSEATTTPSTSAAPTVLAVPVPPGSADAASDGPAGSGAEVRTSDLATAAAADEDSDVPWAGGLVFLLCLVLAGAWTLRSRSAA